MQARPVLMLTHDDLLWAHWKRVSPTAWMPARARSWGELARWSAMDRRLVILDSGLPQLPALDSEAWRREAGKLDLVVGSLNPSDEEGRAFLVAGAKGYIHAYTQPEALDTVLKVVGGGGVWMGQTLLARLLQQLERGAAKTGTVASSWTDGLTPREVEVARMAASGRSNQSIADELNITERTVRAHISSVFEKLGVSDRLLLALKVHGISQ